MAGHVKRTIDSKFGPTWHAVVGQRYGSYVTHETKHFIYFCKSNRPQAGKEPLLSKLAREERKDALTIALCPFGVVTVGMGRLGSDGVFALESISCCKSVAANRKSHCHFRKCWL